MEISSPRELIAAIPHLLGFAPEDSLVVVALAENRVHSLVRVDWPLATEVLNGSLKRYAQSLAEVELIFTIYSQTLDHELQQVRNLFQEFSILDELLVRNDRWRSQMCDDFVCCPPEGRSVNYETPIAAAEFVFQGSSPFASREEMVQAIAAEKLSSQDRELCQRAFTGLNAEFEIATEVDWILQAVSVGQLSKWEDFARIVRACQEIRVRDALLRKAFEQFEIRRDLRNWFMRNLGKVADNYVAACATILAGVVWLDGNGPLARIALDRALEADAEYSLAQLLDTALVNAVPSRIWSESLEAVSYQECLQGAA